MTRLNRFGENQVTDQRLPFVYPRPSHQTAEDTFAGDASCKVCRGDVHFARRYDRLQSGGTAELSEIRQLQNDRTLPP